MREIKFRAWDGKLMIEPSMNMVITSYSGMPMWSFAYEPLMPQPDWILMQYTGLKDKDGTEIYEGDILKNGGKVLFDNGLFCCEHGYEWGQIEPSDEVIGNVYENPDLLEK